MGNRLHRVRAPCHSSREIHQDQLASYYPLGFQLDSPANETLGRLVLYGYYRKTIPPQQGSVSGAFRKTIR
jgi:hypothetical protein